MKTSKGLRLKYEGTLVKSQHFLGVLAFCYRSKELGYRSMALVSNRFAPHNANNDNANALSINDTL